MNLIFLHGPPASGKFTVAKELEQLIGSSIFHNHLAIDAAKPFFEFGTDKFWDLVKDLRRICLKAGAKSSTRTITYTCCYDHPNDLSQFEEIEKIVSDSNGSLFPVFLDCKKSTLEARVNSQYRVNMGKIHSIEGLHNTLKNWNCIQVPRANCLTISTDNLSSLQCAKQIIEHFKLG